MPNTWVHSGTTHIVRADQSERKRISNGGAGSLFISTTPDFEQGDADTTLKEGESQVFETTFYVNGNGGQRVTIENASSGITRVINDGVPEDVKDGSKAPVKARDKKGDKKVDKANEDEVIPSLS